MANDDPGKFSTNLKVPPLKIVLGSHQNNTVVNLGSIEDSRPRSNEGDGTNQDRVEPKSLNRRDSADYNGDRDKKETDRRGSKHSNHDRIDSDQVQMSQSRASGSSSPTSSSVSERSDAASPNSEADSIASNSTIIAENQHHKPQQQSKGAIKTSKDTDDISFKNNRDERCSKNGSRVASNERSSNNLTNNQKRQNDSDHNADVLPNQSTREHNLNSNQRITRSSQRAAQQYKTEPGDNPVVDEPTVGENQEKNQDLTRKAKRRKIEPQEIEQAQSAAPPTITMATIDPADYQLPSQNSFELYRDIRKQPYKKLLKLSHTQPKTPHGFKNYLINGGPYLLDGNKLGFGLNGARMTNKGVEVPNGNVPASRAPLRMKMSNINSRFASLQRHSSYDIPKPLEVPKNLQAGTALYELFKDQEKDRHQMRMQHLKERERAILAAEQEILRAYNKAAIADMQQKLHLSACTFFYYQERYHYIDDKSINDDSEVKEASSDKESFLKQLQEIDDKWDKIKRDMLVRHKNEADSLHAVQSLEWEWKAKEIGVCDIRVSLKIEPEFVPRVEVAALNY